MLIVLGRFDALVALVGDDRLADLEPATIEIDITGSQPGELAPAEAAVGERQHGGVVAVARALSPTTHLDRESGHLVV